MGIIVRAILDSVPACGRAAVVFTAMFFLTALLATGVAVAAIIIARRRRDASVARSWWLSGTVAGLLILSVLSVLFSQLSILSRTRGILRMEDVGARNIALVKTISGFLQVGAASIFSFMFLFFLVLVSVLVVWVAYQLRASRRNPSDRTVDWLVVGAAVLVPLFWYSFPPTLRFISGLIRVFAATAHVGPYEKNAFLLKGTSEAFENVYEATGAILAGALLSLITCTAGAVAMARRGSVASRGTVSAAFAFFVSGVLACFVAHMIHQAVPDVAEVWDTLPSAGATAQDSRHGDGR